MEWLWKSHYTGLEKLRLNYRKQWKHVYHCTTRKRNSIVFDGRHLQVNIWNNSGNNTATEREPHWWRWQRRRRGRVIETKLEQGWKDWHSLNGECKCCAKDCRDLHSSENEVYRSNRDSSIVSGEETFEMVLVSVVRVRDIYMTSYHRVRWLDTFPLLRRIDKAIEILLLNVTGKQQCLYRVYSVLTCEAVRQSSGV